MAAVLEFRSKSSFCSALPLRPSTLPRLRAALFSMTPEVSSLTQIASQDPGLAMHILRLANADRVGSETWSLSEAVVLAGRDQLRTLCSADPTLCDSGYIEEIAHHARLTALYARRLATVSGLADPEKAFVSGLLHNIGDLVSLAARNRNTHITSMILGAELCRAWSLPLFLVDVVANHASPAAASIDVQLVSIVAIGAALASSNGGGLLPYSGRRGAFHAQHR